MKNYIQTYQSFINEALGVPSNLVSIANQVYNEMMKQPLDRMSYSDLSNSTIKLNGSFVISDYRAHTINVNYELVKSSKFSELTLLGAAQRANQPGLNTKNLRMVNFDNGEINLSFDWAFPSGGYFRSNDSTAGVELKKYLEKNKAEIISNLSHEIMHAYQQYKQRETAIPTRAEYTSNNELPSQIGIGAMRRLLYYMYFTSSTENSVRAAEVAGEMDAKNTQQKDFKEFLISNRTYKTLNEIRGYSYEKFIGELNMAINYIRDFLGEAWFDDESLMDKRPDKMTDDEAITQYLRMMMSGIVNFTREVSSQISNSLLSDIYRTNPNSTEFRNLVNRVEKQVNSYGTKEMNMLDDPSKFFRNKLQNASRQADLLIRKISKLYAMAKTENAPETPLEKWKREHK